MGLHTDEYILAPTWETQYEAGFYELAGGAPGIVHEGRYVKEGCGWHPTMLFGPGLEMRPREMLACYYAFLRGAARAHDGDWGTAIYGQSDPDMRVDALTLAYDMGAKYLWYWTSDHDHHVPYTEQLALTKALMQHANEHPRGSPGDLRRAARTAIAFPPGYTLAWDRMWGGQAFALDSVNETGTLYRDVVAAAMWEGVLYAKRGASFDFTVQHPGLDRLGYERVVGVSEDAFVMVEPIEVSTRPVTPGMAIEVERTGDLKIDSRTEGTMPAHHVEHRSITIDGSFEDWPELDGYTHVEEPSGRGEWDGPQDLGIRVGFLYDERFLYIAADVTDDRHSQPFYGWEMWKGDSVQIGFDPMNEENRLGYSGNQHELGLVLLDSGRALVWRWYGRVGQPLDEMRDARIAIVRNEDEGHTRYEAAIPLAELSPLSPWVEPKIGLALTVNDADAKPRETYHETSPGAMVGAKNPADFRKLYFRYPPSRESEGGAHLPPDAVLVWDRTVVPSGGWLTLDCLARGGMLGAVGMMIEAELEPMSPLAGTVAGARTHIVVEKRPSRYEVRLRPDTEPGRYRLTVSVRSLPHIREVSAMRTTLITKETRTVYVYPGAP
jgi:hypothetical protein